jgi:glycosyltransferase involved in cell wall biosynthesis
MRVLMLGWEFPPFISGGLGTACYGLTRAMSQMGIEVVFVLPRPVDGSYATHVKMASPQSVTESMSEKLVFDDPDFANVSFRTIPAMMQPYQTPQSYEDITSTLKAKGLSQEIFGSHIRIEDLGKSNVSGHYTGDLFQEIQRYARLATVIARGEEFDVVHAHDWMTYPAGIAVSAVSGKPLVLHIHSTEFDRSGENVHQEVYDIERQGFHYADRILAVSYLTRNVVISRYSVPSDKVDVVYNAIEREGEYLNAPPEARIDHDEKIVLFLGRITMQKGPEYFLAAAKKVLNVMDNVKFVMAGSGDLIQRTIELAAEMGIGHKVLFTGFLRGDDVDRIFRMADLFVMPSVSEPFGLVPLEALRNDVPVIISKQSGVAEVLTHVLKVDFWDIDEMANKIVAVLRHQPLQATLREHGNFEVRKLSWSDAAQRCSEAYESLMALA